MITAAMHLASFGLTCEDARAWVMARLDDPALVFEAATQYGVSAGMLAEIAGGGATADLVVAFFGARGIDASGLDAGVDRVGIHPAGLGLADLLTLNHEGGMLSTAVLRARVQEEAGELPYWEMFSPNRIDGAADGVLSMPELGTGRLGDVSATAAHIESLFYGTTLKILSCMDAGELAGLQDYVSKNAGEMLGGDKPAMAGYVQLLDAALADPAGLGAMTDEAAGQLVADAVAAGVQLVGAGIALDLLLPIFLPAA